jgi:hypothetical protein
MRFRGGRLPPDKVTQKSHLNGSLDVRIGVGKQAERQPLKNRDVALIRNKDLQSTREHDIQEMRPPNQ